MWCKCMLTATTKKESQLKPKAGDHVIAKVNDKGHAISFLTEPTYIPLTLLSNQHEVQWGGGR